ncbi:hypothetical protein UPYG_G00186640 [Umbra pygmaea]|uniref:Uncharacterized protein n=1 Tax=Umbra pygmaea TaxID=75934 RepID=A0ABD0WS85_UMBPY
MFHSGGLCLDKAHSAWLPRPTSWLQRPISCFETGSLRLSADNTSSNEVDTSFLYAQGICCTLQHRPSNSARVTSRNHANTARVRPVNSALCRLENSPGRRKTHGHFNRPVTAAGGGGGLRDLGHGVQLKNRTECPRVPCIAKPDNSDGQQQGRWRGSLFSRSSTLHLYLPSTSLSEDEQINLENEVLRPTGQNVVPSDTLKTVRTPSLSESVTMQ